MCRTNFQVTPHACKKLQSIKHEIWHVSDIKMLVSFSQLSSNNSILTTFHPCASCDLLDQLNLNAICSNLPPPSGIPQSSCEAFSSNDFDETLPPTASYRPRKPAPFAGSICMHNKIVIYTSKCRRNAGKSLMLRNLTTPASSTGLV